MSTVNFYFLVYSFTNVHSAYLRNTQNCCYSNNLLLLSYICQDKYLKYFLKYMFIMFAFSFLLLYTIYKPWKKTGSFNQSYTGKSYCKVNQLIFCLLSNTVFPNNLLNLQAYEAFFLKKKKKKLYYNLLMCYNFCAIRRMSFSITGKITFPFTIQLHYKIKEKSTYSLAFALLFFSHVF